MKLGFVKNKWVLLLLLIFLTACGNSKYQSAFDNGMKYLNEGDYEQAIVCFTEAISIDPKKTDAYNMRGTAYVYMHQYEDAVDDFSEVVRIDENAYDMEATLDLFAKELEKDEDSVEKVYYLLIDAGLADPEKLFTYPVFKAKESILNRKVHDGYLKYSYRKIEDVARDLGNDYTYETVDLFWRDYGYSYPQLGVAFELVSTTIDGEIIDDHIGAIWAFEDVYLGDGLNSRMTYNELSEYAKTHNCKLADTVFEGYFGDPNKEYVWTRLTTEDYEAIYLWRNGQNPYETESNVVLLYVY